jgi:hypothetical protein
VDISSAFTPSPATPDPNITGYIVQWFNGGTVGSGTPVGVATTIPRVNPDPASYQGPNISVADAGINLVVGAEYYFSVVATDTATGLSSTPTYSNVVTLVAPANAPASPGSATATQI